MRVECYFNLHKRTFSVRALEGEHKGRVIAHRDCVWLRDATFIVQPAGRERVIREQRKNVHAFVRGTLVDDCKPLNAQDGATRVTYNPYKADHFQTLDGERIDRADVVGLANLSKPYILTYRKAA